MEGRRDLISTIAPRILPAPRLVLLLSLALLIGYWAGQIRQADPANAAASPADENLVLNGDTNGDGTRDISDAIYLLSWLFVDGPEPVELSPRFIDNGDGTVTDTVVGLMWQQGTADTNNDGSIDADDMLTKEAAVTYVRNLRLAGHEDWDLPGTPEPFTILDSSGEQISPNPVFKTEDGFYWIGSTNAGDPCHGANFAIPFLVSHNPWMTGYLEVLGDGSLGYEKAFVLAVRTTR